MTLADVRLAIQNSPEYVFFPQLWQTCAGVYARVCMYVFIGFRVVLCFGIRYIE